MGVLFAFWKQCCSSFIEFQSQRTPLKCLRTLQNQVLWLSRYCVSPSFLYPLPNQSNPQGQDFYKGLEQRWDWSLAGLMCSVAQALQWRKVFYLPSLKLLLFDLVRSCACFFTIHCSLESADAEVLRISHSFQSLRREVQSPPFAGELENWTLEVFFW